jgi:tryptophan 2,3-dioxygenase
MHLQAYLQQLTGAVSNQDGSAVASLFRISTTASVQDLAQYADSATVAEISRRSGVPNHLDAAIAAHCVSSLLLTQNSDWERAFDMQLQCSKAFLEYYRQPEMDWLVPALQCTLVNLRQVAQRVDKALGLGKDKR